MTSSFDRLSQLEQLATLPPEEAEKHIRELPVEAAEKLMYDWSFLGRPSQQPPPGEWGIWIQQSGRGAGKTRACAEWVRRRVDQGFRYIGLVARTARDTRDVMVEGESGLLSVFPPHERPTYKPSLAKVEFHTGAEAHMYAAEEPNALRGPQHDTMWWDEVASWQYGEEAVSNALLGLRLGNDPRAAAGTTPKPVKFYRELLKQPGVKVTRAATFENLQNLAPQFRARIIAKFEGTRLGRQELYGELLEDTIGALWTQRLIDDGRVDKQPLAKDGSLLIYRTVVAVDPPASSDENTAAECGIVVVGLAANGHVYVLEDASMFGRPQEWGRAAIGMLHKWKGDRIVAESNNGGEMVGFVLATIDRYAPIQLVWASRGKQARAEPVSSLYEQMLVHHIGYFPELEDQLTTWVPGLEKSPDRLDAVVWGVYALVLAPDTSEVHVYDQPARISPV